MNGIGTLIELSHIMNQDDHCSLVKTLTLSFNKSLNSGTLQQKNTLNRRMRPGFSRTLTSRQKMPHKLNANQVKTIFHVAYLLASTITTRSRCFTVREITQSEIQSSSKLYLHVSGHSDDLFLLPIVCEILQSENFEVGKHTRSEGEIRTFKTLDTETAKVTQAQCKSGKSHLHAVHFPTNTIMN
jgi:hypothetical protein